MNAREYRKIFTGQARDHLQQARKALINARQAAALGARVAMMAAKMAQSAPWCWAGSSGKIYITVRMTVATFKDPQLAALLEWAMGILGEDATSSDYPDMNQRDYCVRGQGVQMEIHASLAERTLDSTCYRRQTGIKIVEVPQYEFVCQ